MWRASLVQSRQQPGRNAAGLILRRDKYLQLGVRLSRWLEKRPNPDPDVVIASLLYGHSGPLLLCNPTLDAELEPFVDTLPAFLGHRYGGMNGVPCVCAVEMLMRIKMRRRQAQTRVS